MAFANVLLTNHDVLQLLNERSMRFMDTELRNVTLQRADDGQLTASNGVYREGDLLVGLDRNELIELARGRPVTKTADGTAPATLTVRMATVDELMQLVKEAGDRLAADGFQRGPGITRDKAIELTRTLP